MKNKLTVFLGLLFLTQYVIGQSRDYDVKPTLKTYFNSYYEDTKTVVTRPFHFNKKQWITTGVIAATGIFLVTQDLCWDESLAPYRDKQISKVNHYTLDQLGSGVVPLLLSGGIYVNGMVHENNFHKHVALNLVKGFILTSAATEVAKQLFHRHRPEQAYPGQWDGPFSNVRYRSFPSRHASAVFAVSAILAKAYPQHKWIGITAYTLAGISSLARIYDHHHYASDVFFGAVLGYYIGETIANQSANQQRVQLSLTENGIGFVYKW